ncbi:hypothetical protein EVAR_42525_1 [Eumeta japonica]|uniref:Uncharacterized protein n=1 Tax=Eumeta variegata TaxID=151549 RepID=A0A4C1XEA3_EUMVA|nr:hypothetical protein EVAR_42525_1 [Eumeta japonica]
MAGVRGGGEEVEEAFLPVQLERGQHRGTAHAALRRHCEYLRLGLLLRPPQVLGGFRQLLVAALLVAQLISVVVEVVFRGFRRVLSAELRPGDSHPLDVSEPALHYEAVETAVACRLLYLLVPLTNELGKWRRPPASVAQSLETTTNSRQETRFRFALLLDIVYPPSNGL